MKKRGLSPVIATVLLIAMVIIIGLIIFLWFRGMVEEQGIKFGQNIKLACEDVEFEASYDFSADMLYVSNIGNVPIYAMKIKIFEGGGYSTIDLNSAINQGGVFSGSIGAGSADKIILIPVLLGNSKEGYKSYTCEEIYGHEIF